MDVDNISLIRMIKYSVDVFVSLFFVMGHNTHELYRHTHRMQASVPWSVFTAHGHSRQIGTQQNFASDLIDRAYKLRHARVHTHNLSDENLAKIFCTKDINLR